MKIKFWLLTSAVFLPVHLSQATTPVKNIVKPLGLTLERGTNKKDFNVDHPFNRALVSAFNTNPQLRSKVKEQYANAEAVAQALGGWRPSVKLQGSLTRAWSERQSPAQDNGSRWTTPHGASASLEQNLFSGGRTVAQTEKAEASVYAGFADLANTEQKVLFSAIDTYLDLWLKHVMLGLQRNNVEIKQKTLTQTRARHEVGEVTLTDVSLAEADLSDAIAKRIQAEAELAVAKEAYLQVIGEEPGEVLAPPPLIELREMPRDKHEMQLKAARNNPAIRSAEFSKKASMAAIDVETSSLLPSVDFTAKASRNLQDQGRESRSNSGQFGITVTVPLYQQGIEWSKIRESSQLAAKSKIDLVTVQRNVQQEVTRNWESWVSSSSQIEQLKVQIEAAKISLEGTRQENLVGERTLLDVLTAENKLLQAETNLANAQKNYLSAGYSILSSMGELMAIDLGLPVEPYPVKENYEKASVQWAGTSDYPTR